MRSGTLATHQIVGVGEAFRIARLEMAAENERIRGLRDRLWKGLSEIEEVHLNGDLKRRIPGNLNVSFNFVEGESLIMGLKEIAVFVAKRGKGVGLRLGVRTSGCSGMAYKLEFADSVNPEDSLFESHGVKVVVDPKSLPYLEGTELDFAREGLNQGFKFRNPNVKDQCGCGESFNI